MRNPDVESHAVRISVGLQTADRHLTSHFVSLHTTWANCGTRTNLLITFTFFVHFRVDNHGIDITIQSENPSIKVGDYVYGLICLAISV